MMDVSRFGKRALLFLKLIFYPHLRLFVISDDSAEVLQVSLFNRIKILDCITIADKSEEWQVMAFLEKWLACTNCPSYILLDNRTAFTICRQVEIGTFFSDQEALKGLLSGTKTSLSSLVIKAGSGSYALIQGVELAFLNSLKKIEEHIGIPLPEIMTLSSFLLQRIPLPSEKRARLILISFRQELLDFVVVDECGNVLHASRVRNSAKLEDVANDLSETYLGKRAEDVQILGLDRSKVGSASGSGTVTRLPLFSFSKTGLGTRYFGSRAETPTLRRRLIEGIHYARIALSLCLALLGIIVLAFVTTSILAAGRAKDTDTVYRSLAERRNLVTALDSLRHVEHDLLDSRSQLPATAALFSLFCQERFDDVVLTELRAVRQDQGALTVVASGKSTSEQSVFHLQQYLNDHTSPAEFSLRTLTRASDTDYTPGVRSFAFTLALVINENAHLE